MKTTLIVIFSGLLLITGCGRSDEASKDSSTSLKDVQKALYDKRKELKNIKAEISKLEDIISKLNPESKKEKETPVTVRKVQVKNFSHFVEVQGNVMPMQDPVFASSETGGRIIELNVIEGQFINKGDLVAQVNLESINKSIAQIEESLKLAKDIFERQENLWNQKIGSEIQYLQAKSQVESLIKNKESLEFELTKANVYAPASGYVDMIMAKSGEMCGPGTPIVQIVNTNKLKVVASVPEIYLGKAKKGQKVLINFPALDQEQYGRIIMIGRSIHPANRTFEVEASIKSKNGLLKPNLLATMLIQDLFIKAAIVVPDELILQDVSGANFVMIIEEDRAVKRVVKMGKGYQNETVIVGGLTGEEVLVIKGSRQISEGDLLKVLSDN